MQPSPRPDDATATSARTWALRQSAPDNEVPVPLPVSLVLGRTSDVAVAVCGVQAYTTGLSLTVAVRLRTAGSALQRRLHELVSGHGPTAAHESASQRLLLGVQLADGRTATNLAPRLPSSRPNEADRQRPLLLSHGGSGGGLHHDQRYWLSPLPPDGPLTLVFAWPAFDMPETRHVLDGAALRAAGLAAEVLWPVSPPAPPAPAPPPTVPAGGWFEAALSETG